MSGMGIQTTIGKTPKGFKGQNVDSNNIRTENKVAGSDVEVGTFATADATGIIPLSGAGAIAGFVKKSDEMTGTIITAGSNLTLAKEGYFYAYSETAQTEGTNPYIRHTSNGALNVGDIRNDEDTANAVQNTKVSIAETITQAGLVKIYINL